MDKEQEEINEEEYVGAEEFITKLHQIRAVNEAVIKNLQVRSKRDDEKVNNVEKSLKELMERPWYKNLGNLGAVINEFKSANLDLNVTHLSIMKQLESYNNELNKWAETFEHNQEQIATLQQLNNDLSISLKEVEAENRELKKGKKSKTPEKEEE